MVRKRKTRTVYRRAKVHYKRHKKTYGIIGTVAGAAIYGAFRARVSNYLSQWTSKIPLGNVADEVGMGLLCILGKKFVGRRVPFSKKIFDAGLTIEAARVGEAIATGNIGLGSTSGSNNLFDGGGF